MNKYIISAIVAIGLVATGLYFFNQQQNKVALNESTAVTSTFSGETRTALVAGGCFWCVEADLEKYTGVISAVSGYAGGEGENPTYEDSAKRGFREVVEVTYDPTQVSFENIVEYVIRHSDATDPEGSFFDRGNAYTSAAYYETPEQKEIIEKVVQRINDSGVYDKPLALYIEPITTFYEAEEYHQDYYKKNSLKYSYYRKGSGRDAFIEKHWGDDTVPTPVPELVLEVMKKDWKNFVRPSDAELRTILTPLQYKVAVEDGTETPFKNEYDANKEAGIYVDIVSGEPLYSSKDKFDSGTGWPSFVKPITPDAVIKKDDKKLFITRTEIRSAIGDFHIGHVFDDGPADRGGLRYCMNSAAMEFIPKADMERLGYGEYVQYVE